MIIKFFSNYASSEDLLRRFTANYEISDQTLSFTTGERYDAAVVFNRTDAQIPEGVKIITIIQEPSWSLANQQNPYLSKSDILVVHDRQLFESFHGIKLGGEVIESPSYMFYHDHIDHTFFETVELEEKVSKLSMIVSGIDIDYANYGKRMNLLRRILASDLEIDIFGKGLMLKDDRYKGELQYKFKGLIPYEFSICIENSNETNYITEKFIDCALCNTIPIYTGAPNVSDVYDDQYFRKLNLDSEDPVMEIKEIIKTPFVFSDVNKHIYRDKYNLYALIKKLLLAG